MGCCWSRKQGSRLKEEKQDEYTGITGQVNSNMPGGKGKRGPGETSTPQGKGRAQDQPPRKTRKYQEECYKVPASDWNGMVASIDNYKRHIAQLEDKHKIAEKHLKDSQIDLKTLRDDNKNLKEEVQGCNTKIVEKDSEMKTLHTELNCLRNNKEAIGKEVQSLRKELTALRRENDQLLNRVSALTGAKLVNNNPNIANLADSNRPTRLADYYCELYDNEWTDAVGELGDKGIDERKAVDILRDILTETYKLCDIRASQQTEMLNSTLEMFTKGKEMPVEMLQRLKETRKDNFADFIPELTKDMDEKLSKTYSTVMTLTKVRVYCNRSLELCWLMCIQDPPVYMDCDSSIHGQAFNKATHKAYTVTGSLVNYLVWPVLYLHKGNAVLCKGTAQAIAKSSR